MLFRQDYNNLRPRGQTTGFLREWRILLLALLLAAAQGCQSQPAASLPPELIGTWRTDHPKYAGLYFQITPGSFAFSTAEGTVETYTLTAYQQEEAPTLRNNKGVKHLLRGTKPGQETELAILYDGSGGGAIRFANRGPIVWLRASGAAQ